MQADITLGAGHLKKEYRSGEGENAEQLIHTESVTFWHLCFRVKLLILVNSKATYRQFGRSRYKVIYRFR